MTNSNTEFMSHLKEIFPTVAEDFLTGLCDAYKDANLDIEELIDVVLSFEFLPQKETFKENDHSEILLNSATEFPEETFIQAIEVAQPEEVVGSIFVDDDFTTDEEVLVELSPGDANKSIITNNKLHNTSDINDDDSFNLLEIFEIEPGTFNVVESHDSLATSSIIADLQDNSRIQTNEIKSDDSTCSSTSEVGAVLSGELSVESTEKAEDLIEITESLPSERILLINKQSKENVEALSNMINGAREELDENTEESLENKDYPKQKKNKTMETFQCTVSNFLEEIPDPVAEFSSDYYLRTDYEENAEIYLQSRYKKLTPETIKKQLKNSKYNLTKVCQLLEGDGYEPSHYNLDTIPLHHTPSIFFHQEVWYIEHKEEIQNFLDSVLEAAKVEEELNRPPTPPSVKEVFECGICMDEVAEYADLATCDGPGGDLFCKNCIRRNCEIRIGEGAITFPCLANCSGFIPLQTIEEVTTTKLFTILMAKIQEEEVRSANIAGVEMCPFCPYAYGPGEDDLFICKNPVCMKESCRICKKANHLPEICEMFQKENEETARHYIEEKMTEALVRVCNACGKEIVKAEGCNKMTCTCGAKMCYMCRQPVVDYTHFNGPGGDNFNRCELFSDDMTVHDRPVSVSAEQAVNDLIANNPGINLDRNALIPR